MLNRVLAAGLVAALSGAALGVDTSVEFPSSDTTSYTGYGGFSTVGSGGGGVHFQAGDFIEKSFPGTATSSAGSARFQFRMSNFMAPDAGLQDFNVSINGTVIGSYALDASISGDNSFDLFYDFSGSPIAGPDYTLRFEALDTVYSGGGSYNWYPGGTATLFEIPSPGAFALLGLGGLAAARRRR